MRIGRCGGGVSLYRPCLLASRIVLSPATIGCHEESSLLCQKRNESKLYLEIQALFYDPEMFMFGSFWPINDSSKYTLLLSTMQL